jgi:hypothetical protein
MGEFEKNLLDSQAHEIFPLWYYRIDRNLSYVKGGRPTSR